MYIQSCQGQIFWGGFMREFTGFQKGVNLGGWLSQCSFEKAHMDSFITEEDLWQIHNMGLDHVRLPFDYCLVEEDDGTPKESGYEYIDNCIAWCKKHNLNLVLDLHKAAGYSFEEKEESMGFFEDKDLQKRFIKLWEQLARRYGSYRFVAFELLNEIIEPSVMPEWNAIATRTIKAIRTITKDSWIIVGGSIYNSAISVKELNIPIDERIVFTYHCYEPIVFAYQSAYWIPGMTKGFQIDYPLSNKSYKEAGSKLLDPFFLEPMDTVDDNAIGTEWFEEFFKEAVEIAEEKNVPLYCGEYGVVDQADLVSAVKWHEDINKAFEKYHISRCLWCYKGMDFGLLSPHYAPVINHLISLL